MGSSTKPKLTFDYSTGYRGRGLVLYCALPANFALLGVLKLESAALDAISLLWCIPISILPLLLAYMLIRNRLGSWYVSSWLGTRRSLVLVVISLLVAMLICGSAGLIRGSYQLGMPSFQDPSFWHAIAESYLLAVLALAASGSIFSSSLVKGVSLPGLPSEQFVALVREFSTFTGKLNSSLIYSEYSVDAAKRLLEEGRELCSSIENLPPQSRPLPIGLVDVMLSDVAEFISALEDITCVEDEGAQIRAWRPYFLDTGELNDDERDIRNNNMVSAEAVARLKEGRY